MFRSFVVLIALVICAGFVASVQAEDKENVVGAVWRVILTRGDLNEEHRIRVYKDEIFQGAEKVGTVNRKDEDETVLRIYGAPSMNGRYVLMKAMNGIARGTCKKEDGTEWKVRIHMINH